METASIAPSEATTLVNGTGIVSNEKPTETVEVKLSELLDEAELEKYNSRVGASRSRSNESTLGKLFGSKKNKDGDASASDPVKKIKMTPSEYKAYWARDADGKYLGTEPEGAGREIWRRKLWAELYLPPPTAAHDVSAYAGKNAKPGAYSAANEAGGWGQVPG